jgi:cell division protein FtsB
MDRNYFDQIAQEIVRQKQRMDQLEAENRELRQQLADLRAGRGIFVEIAGSRFALRGSLSSRDSLARTR